VPPKPIFQSLISESNFLCQDLSPAYRIPITAWSLVPCTNKPRSGIPCEHRKLRVSRPRNLSPADALANNPVAPARRSGLPHGADMISFARWIMVSHPPRSPWNRLESPWWLAVYSFSAASYLSFFPSSRILQPIPPVAQPQPRFAHRLAPARARPAAVVRFRIRSGVSWRRISGVVRPDLGKGPVLADFRYGARPILPYWSVRLCWSALIPPKVEISCSRWKNHPRDLMFSSKDTFCPFTRHMWDLCLLHEASLLQLWVTGAFTNFCDHTDKN
jgi:hypothetical protein